MKISGNAPSKPEIIPGFVSSLIEKVKSLPLGEDEVFEVKLSLEEALINAVKHGNKMNLDLFVEVCLEAEKDELVITIKDQGRGFDFSRLSDPTIDENLAKSGGRGIFLIRELMDKVEFYDGGRGIKMVKFLKSGGKK